MAYPTLKKLFYADPTNERFANREAEANRRLLAPSTYRTGIMLEHGELFCAVPRELSSLAERILCRERRIEALCRRLPGAALGSFIRGLILEEVESSNGMEGVHSTREQVDLALREAERRSTNHADAAIKSHPAFMEYAKLYLGLSRDPVPPQSIDQIRQVYEAVVQDVLDKRDALGDAALFRTGPVVIEKRGGKIVHTGVPAARIEGLLSQMIALTNSDDMPQLYSAVLGHFLFEYVHPFYDGNGRTGRYLLAANLSEVLSQATVLSLCRVISQNKARYYKAFDETEDRFNASEGTHFVLALLELVSMAQEDLLEDLEQKQAVLSELQSRLKFMSGEFSKQEQALLFYGAQAELYALPGGFEQREIADYLGVSAPTARRVLSLLIERGHLERISGRPARYRLTPAARDLLALP